MKMIYVMMGAALMMAGCNESRRGNDSNVNETRNEAAAESNADKFEGQTQKDSEFVYEVVASNYSEIKLAELANQKSRNKQVKEVAQTLLTDHTASLNELKILAQAKAISIPVQERDASKRKLENLAEESGEDFDEAWAREMMQAHDEMIEKFEDRLEDTQDAELKGYIEKTLPVLKKHHDALEACHEELKENA